MVKDIFDTILEKEFHQLTSNELAEMAEFCKNEEEFLAMKQVLAHSKTIAEGPKLSPMEETKEKLDNLFDSTHGRERRIIPFYLNPIIQIAAVVVVGFAVWMFMLNSDTGGKTQMAENTIPKEDESSSEEKPIQKDKKNEESNQSDSLTLRSISSIGTKIEVQKPQLKEKGLTLPDHDNYMAESSPLKFDSAPQSASSKTDKKISAEMHDDIAVGRIEEELKAKTYQSVSAPASSVKDISVDSSKSPYKNQTVVSMNVASQQNVMNYLVAKY